MNIQLSDLDKFPWLLLKWTDLRVNISVISVILTLIEIDIYFFFVSSKNRVGQACKQQIKFGSPYLFSTTFDFWEEKKYSKT